MDPSNLTRAPGLWFSNGDVVIKAESTLFCVTRGILAYHSPVLLQLLMHSESNVFVEGCRVLTLPDSSEDVTHFLRAIHDSTYYNPSQSTGFAVIAGILRLSTKYEVHGLRQSTVRHLQRIFPSSLELWDERSKAGNDTIQKFRGRTIAVIKIALETKHHVLLPSSMAYSWAIGLEDLLDSELDWDTKRTCLIARDRLTSALRSRLLAFIHTPAGPSCTSKSKCNQGRLVSLARWEAFFSETVPTPFRVDPNWTDLSGRLCDVCLADSRDAFLTARWVLWDELPSFFDLESWEVLAAKADLERQLPAEIVL